ncbi:MAG: hypothetical protein QGF36_00825 [Candidatus Marinimicrobia bacterium]|jgi:hypothetical protein|nr:hypothetical protein [Candidatus Neomarinimicrobiota bacterium]MDP6853436.1 hypothetical protein [Candidatus Neomarinimicrobiota bacterium]MDP6935951.1 hypothetical protein [Candidatus Neomarinimicrobiota bacterium]
MPNIKNTGFQSQLNPDLKNKKQLIIEEERIRVLGDSLLAFYDKLTEKYLLIQAAQEEGEEASNAPVPRSEIETFVRDYAATKPLGF